MAPDESLTRPASAGWQNAGAERTSSAAIRKDAVGIWIANADGSSSRKVITRPFISASTPAISPDGRLIVFFQSSGGPMGDLWIVPPSGGPLRRLTFDDTEGGTPTWTPDGQFVIFSSKRTGSHTLWRIPVGGGEAEPMTSGAGEDRDPQLSFDGRRLLYTNVRNSFSLEMLNVSTGGRTSLATRRTTIAGPRFSPSGDHPAALVGKGGRAVLPPNPAKRFVSESFRARRRFHRSRALAVKFVG
jgi:Tol biopolymer transport system component